MTKAHLHLNVPSHPLQQRRVVHQAEINVSEEQQHGLTAFYRQIAGGFVVGILDRVHPPGDLPTGATLDQIHGWITAQSLRYSYLAGYGHELKVVTDPMATCPLFYGLADEGLLAVATTATRVQQSIQSHGLDQRYLSRRPLPENGKTVFTSVNSAPPASCLSFKYLNNSWINADTSRYYALPPTSPIDDVDYAISSIRQTLTTAVQASLGSEPLLFATLSGGVDSTSVVCLAKRADRDLETFTVGTPHGNEYEPARKTAKAIGSKHHELLFTADDLKELLPILITGLETWDPLTLQIAAPTIFLYKHLGAQRTTFLTGYGSDLIFAGILKPPLEEPVAEQMLRDQIALTVPTNEMSPYLAARFGVTVRCPFWNPAFMYDAMLISAKLKMLNGTEKWIFRKAMEGIVPQDVLWRKKLGIHEGARMDLLFAEVLGSANVDQQLLKLAPMACELLAHKQAA
jgi:carbapenam-3-carboxylate synthase